MPKTPVLSLADEKNIYNLQNKESATTISKHYRISTSRVYDIWRKYNDAVMNSKSCKSSAVSTNNLADEQIINKLEKKIKKLKDEITSYKSTIEDCNNITADQKYEIKMLKNSADTQIATNKNLESIIDDQKDEIKLLQERVNNCKDANSNPAEILQFKYKIGLLENEIKHLNEKLKNKSKKIDSLKKLIRESKTEPPKQDELEKVINELNNVKYHGLNALQDKYRNDGFRVLGVPCNQFHYVSSYASVVFMRTDKHTQTRITSAD
ncbi:hypothetical protein CHS0354_034657 [Potamilus streckersoni]|uniref:Uncharacterized protein n=1 Tax=Potamilus streckersoni TaxID=2493646 RepID=A0AAE0WBL6_9BIVA|nr:hypothetical protein CHS0354_034657 [Potamilus streckersoni]